MRKQGKPGPFLGHYFALSIYKGRQFIKLDFSDTPVQCKATRDLYEARGFTCHFFMPTSKELAIKLNKIIRSKEPPKGELSWDAIVK